MAKEFVPFCNEPIITSKTTVYGQVAWNPIAIPYSRELGINVNATNRWLRGLGLSHPLVLGSYSDDSEATTPDMVLRGPVGVIEKVTTRGKREQLQRLHFDDEKGQFHLSFNFSAMERLLASRGITRSDSRFLSSFSALFNGELKRSALRLIGLNNLYLLQDYPEFRHEYLYFMVITLLDSIIESFALAHTPSESLSPEVLLVSVAVIGLINSIFYFGVNMTMLLDNQVLKDRVSMLKKTVDSETWQARIEYLLSDRDGFAKCLFPTQPLRKLVAPLPHVLDRSTLIAPLRI